jgi:hypothetical protein
MSLRRKTTSMVALVVALVFLFTSVASAAVLPKFIYCEDEDGNIVKADYETAMNLALEDDPAMLATIKNALNYASGYAKKAVVVLEDGKVLDWQAALDAGVGFADAQKVDDYDTTEPTATKVVNETGKIVDAEEVLTVVSVSAINANTLEVTFEGVEEPVIIELDEALVHGENEVTFEYEGVEYTVTVDYVDPAVVDAEAAAAVDAEIAALPAVDELTLDNAAAVVAARASYDALTDAQKELVTNLDTLTAAEAKIAELKAADAEAAKQAAIADAREAILALPADITLDDKDTVNGAKAKYDAAITAGATDSEIGANLVTILNNTVAKIAELEQAATDKTATIAAAQEAIIALPSVDEMTVANKAVVDDAKAKYDAAIAAGATDEEIGATLVVILNSAVDKMAELTAADALAAATAAVEAAETSQVQDDVDAAQALVTVLPDGADKDALQARIDTVQAAIDLVATTEAAEAAIAELPEEVKLADKEAVEEARALVDVALEFDAEAEIEGIEKLAAAEAAIKAIEDAVTAAEEAIEGLVPAAEVTEVDRVEIEEARALVNAAKELDENAEIANIEKLEAAEAALEASVPAITGVNADVNNNAKEITVTAVLKNIDAEVELINVELMEVDEEGELISLDPAVEVNNFGEEVKVDEEGNLTAKLDVKNIGPDNYGDYVVVITAGEVLPAEVDVTIDFTAEDAIVKAVNEASTELELEDALVNGEFKDVNLKLITEYRKVLGTNKAKKATVAEIQEEIKTINDNAANQTLVAELKEIATNGTQKELLDALNNAEFKDVEPANINEYQEYLAGEETTEETTKSDIQKKINLINAKANLIAAEANLTTALEKLTDGEDENFVPAQKDVDAAKAALEKVKEADEVVKQAELAINNEDVDHDVSTAIAAAEAAITAAQAKIDEANEGAQALIDAKLAAKAAQADFVNAGGKKGAKVYTALTAAINAEEATVESITTATEAVTAATEALGEYDEAVAAAQAAQAAHINAGGTVEDNEYAVVATALTTNAIVWTVEDLANDLGTKKTKITTATTTLTDATAELTELADTIAAAQEAMGDYIAAGGKDDAEVYKDVKTQLDILKAEDSTEEAITAAVTALKDTVNEEGNPIKGLISTLNDATEELVAVKAINDAIANEDAVTLQNIIVELDVTEFANLTKAQRAEIGAFMIRESKGEEYEEVTSTEEFADNVKAAIISYLADIEAFNTAANAEEHNATTKAAVIAAIKDVMDLDLTASEELDLAEAILEAKSGDEIYAVKTIAEIKAIVKAYL